MPEYYHKLSYSDSKVYELKKHLGQIHGIYTLKLSNLLTLMISE